MRVLLSPEGVSGLEELSAARKNPEVTFASGSRVRSYGKFGLEFVVQLGAAFSCPALRIPSPASYQVSRDAGEGMLKIYYF